MRFHAFHGVLPQERAVGADFYVTLTAKVRVAESAWKSDCLEGTVSYADIAECMACVMSRPVNLLEHLSYTLASTLLDAFPQIESVSLLVQKENPPMTYHAEGVGVKITLFR